MFSFILVHCGLIGYKLYQTPIFWRQHGFSLVVVELGSALFFGIGFVMLLTDFYTWLAVFMMALGWQCSSKWQLHFIRLYLVLWVDLVVYAM